MRRTSDHLVNSNNEGWSTTRAGNMRAITKITRTAGEMNWRCEGDDADDADDRYYCLPRGTRRGNKRIKQDTKKIDVRQNTCGEKYRKLPIMWAYGIQIQYGSWFKLRVALSQHEWNKPEAAARPDLLRNEGPTARRFHKSNHGILVPIDRSC